MLGGAEVRALEAFGEVLVPGVVEAGLSHFVDHHLAAAPALVATLGRGPPPGWQGPPSPLFFFIVRSDAVDAVYGTPEGFEELGVPSAPRHGRQPLTRTYAAGACAPGTSLITSRSVERIAWAEGESTVRSR